jgi:hypothetical protein
MTLLLIATGVRAQQTKVIATVPFDFVVGNRAYPAGEYYLKSVTTNGTVIQVQNTEEDARSLISSIGCTQSMPSTKTKLVFRSMGGSHFLYQVWLEGDTSGREFPRSRMEVQLAKNHEKSELVIVAANVSR